MSFRDSRFKIKSRMNEGSQLRKQKSEPHIKHQQRKFKTQNS